MSSSRRLERASRVANDVTFGSPWTILPVIGFYVVVVFASMVYSTPSIRDVGAPSVVVVGIIMLLWVRVVKGADAIRKHIPFDKLTQGIDLITAGLVVVSWFVYGLMMRYSRDFIPSWVVMVGSIASTGMVFSTYFKGVYTRENLRKSMELLILLVMGCLPSQASVAYDMAWAHILAKLTLFYFLYILTEIESRSLNVPSGEIYYRSEERRATQAGWVLMVPWFLVIFCGVPQIVYLLITVRKRKRLLRKRKQGDGPAHPDVQMATSVVRNAQMGSSPSLNDSFSGRENGGVVDVIDVETVVVDDDRYVEDMVDEEMGFPPSIEDPPEQFAKDGDIATIQSDKVPIETLENGQTEFVPAYPDGMPVITLAPGSLIPAGAIPIIPGGERVATALPPPVWQSPIAGSSASRVSGMSESREMCGRRVPTPFGARFTRKPRSRLGTNIRGSDT